MSKRLFLLDGHSLAHRAFYALPLLQNSDGEYTNAVFGFARMLFRLIDDENPDMMVVAFDRKAPTFRHEEYKEYKANRKKMPDELSPQLGLIKKLLKSLKVPILEKEGFEADDVIGTMARKGEKEGVDVCIVTGDRDAFQLASKQTCIIYTKRGITDTERYDPEKIQKKYELEPDQLVDMKGLMGDSSDNIPGVPGIGEKTAIKLLKEYSSLENVLDNIENISGKKRRENLSKYAAQARMSKELARIIVDVPLDIVFESCKMEEPDEEEVVQLLEGLEFHSLVDRFKVDKEIETDDINFKEIKQVDELKDVLDKVEQNKEMGFSLIMDDLNRPVRADLEKIVFALNAKEVYIAEAEEEIMKILKPVLEKTEVEKNVLSAKETVIALKRRKINLSGLSFEPLLAAYLLHPSDKLPSLEEQLKRELNLTLPDNISREKRTGLLLASLFKFKENLMTRLEKMELMDLYQDIELPLIKVLSEMELNGIKVDREYLEKLSDKWGDELEAITEKIYNLSGEEFNINSPKQLGVILFEKLGLPVIKKTKTGYSTSASVLDELEGSNEIIPLIKEYRQLMKLKSTYVDALPPLINPDTDRIHTSFNQMVTATGRLSSTEPNLQNIPIKTEEGREIRKCFIPEDEDRVLLSADYSQVELRVLAHISSDQNLQEAFNLGEDIHTQTASEVFEVPVDEVTSNMRRHAKVINFGIAYGMSPYGLARDMGVGRKEAENYINRYFERFSGVRKYMDEVVEQAKDNGYVTTIFNRRRYIPEIKSRNYHRRSFAERTAINTPIQGSAADIMKIAMIKVYERLQKEELNAIVLLQVHDELVLEVKKDELSLLARIVKEEMEKAVNLNVPLVVDIQTGSNWRDKKDYHFE